MPRPHLIGLFIALIGLAAPALAETVYIRAGHLIDPERGVVLERQLLRIEGGRVAAVTPDGPVPDGAKLVDWSAFWVLPGMIDMHVHLADVEQTSSYAEPLLHSQARIAYMGARNARTTLMAGFTSVHDVGSYRGLANIELRNAIERGDVIGPRISAVGAYITSPGGGGEVTGMAPDVEIPADMRLGVASTPAEVETRVNAMFQRGADSIKLIATGAVLTEGTDPGQQELSEAMIAAAVQVAKSRGSWVTAHAHGADGIKAAIRGGVRSIEHSSLIDDEGIRLAKAQGTYLVMDFYDGEYISEIGRRDGWNPSILRKMDTIRQAKHHNFTKALKAGVRLSFGTDAGVFPHGENARQFKFLVRYGMTPMQAIQSATTVAAEHLGRAKDVGSLSPGHWADMVAVSRDPLGDITALEQVSHVIKGGEVVR
jgi:imidazolonepropionase-like amidohydrolase